MRSNAAVSWLWSCCISVMKIPSFGNDNLDCTATGGSEQRRSAFPFTALGSDDLVQPLNQSGEFFGRDLTEFLAETLHGQRA